jgi:Skp family chaperone for outer membrane proteins
MKNFNKKIAMILGLAAFSFLLAACHQNTSTASAGKVGVVDMQQLLQSPSVAKLGESIMKTSAPEEAKIKSAYKDLLTTRSAAEKATGAQKKELTDKLTSQTEKFRAMMQAAQKNQMTQENELREKVQSAIAKVAGDESITYVYAKQAVLFGNSEDITDKVIHQLG